jgi:hypothetical protein
MIQTPRCIKPTPEMWLEVVRLLCCLGEFLQISWQTAPTQNHPMKQGVYIY